MVAVMRSLAAVAVAATAVAVAAPAAAGEDDYLHPLQDQYNFLTPAQLLTEGQRACAATSAGAMSPDAVNVVRDDLHISSGAAMDIVSAALYWLC